MGATTHTAALGLPQFADGDRPSWRGDVNGAFADIDAWADKRNKVDSFRLGQNGPDESTALNAWLADTTLSGVRRLTGTAKIGASVVVPDGITLDMRQAKLIQTTANIAVVKLGAGSRIVGGQIVGMSTDFVARVGSFTPSAIGIRVDAAGNSARTSIENVRIVGMGHAGIYVNNTPYLTLTNIDVVGPHGLAGVTVPDGDAGSYGVYVNLASTDMTVTNLRVENTSIGFINSKDSERLSMIGARFRNIKGQHGAYIQNGNGLVVADVTGDSIFYNLVKLQIAAANGAHQYGPSFSNITGTNVGDTVLVVANTDADVTGSWKVYGLTATNIAGYLCNRVAYFANVVGASVSGISGVMSNRDTLTVIDAQDSVFSNIVSRGSGYIGIRLGNAVGSATQRVTVRNARIYNSGNANLGGNKQGVFVACSGSTNDGKNITLDDVHVFADNGFVDYCIQFQQGETSSFRMRNCTGKGYSARAFALPAGTLDVKEWVNNDGDGKLTLNFPTTRPVRTGSVGDAARYACSTSPVSGVFLQGDVIDNTAPAAAGTPGWVCTATGGAYSSTWAATTAYTVGTQVRTSAGRVLACTTAGTSGATEPTMPALGATVTDGTVVWTYVATTLAVFKAMANVAA